MQVARRVEDHQASTSIASPSATNLEGPVMANSTMCTTRDLVVATCIGRGGTTRKASSTARAALESVDTCRWQVDGGTISLPLAWLLQLTRRLLQQAQAQHGTCIGRDGTISPHLHSGQRVIICFALPRLRGAGFCRAQ
ncbi:unnamed protein product [Polarella glacialis]|uniref:Uncharacterized protein n=1 Tax=Polarella glacialis TaxID=89957 RepID=A0A813HG76_POLGL|nr:unnamed protein product [Polarella glacialis]